MTDREIVNKILHDSIISFEEPNITNSIKQEIYSKIKTITIRKVDLQSSQIDMAVGFYLDKMSTQMSFAHTKRYLLSLLDVNKKRFNNTILLFADDIRYLYNFYQANLSTKESLEELMKYLNINARVMEKIKLVKCNYLQIYGEERPF